MATCTYPQNNAELRPESKGLQDRTDSKGRCSRCGCSVPGEKVALCLRCDRDLDIIHCSSKKFPPLKVTR